jgi:uncharacterized protein
MALIQTKHVSEVTIVGVISDTHGLLRPQALEALRDSHIILHAGDVGTSAVLESLTSIAPVVAVRGNVDREGFDNLPMTVATEVGGISLYMLHDVSQLDLKPEVAGFSTVIFGHSHRPLQEERNGVLFFNPGSAGPRRFKLPVSVGKLSITNRAITAEVITLTL